MRRLFDPLVYFFLAGVRLMNDLEEKAQSGPPVDVFHWNIPNICYHNNREALVWGSRQYLDEWSKVRSACAGLHVLPETSWDREAPQSRGRLGAEGPSSSDTDGQVQNPSLGSVALHHPSVRRSFFKVILSETSVSLKEHAVHSLPNV